MRVAVVDYDAGTLRSVETALEYLGADFCVSAEPKEVLAADAVVFPGVGEARSAMDSLNRRGLSDAIRESADAGKPIFAICIGAQIVLDYSEERDTGCLGLVPGVARRFSERPGIKIPHMGWNTLHLLSEHPVFAGLPDDASFYFVHSYYPDPKVAPDSASHSPGAVRRIGTTSYGDEFCAAFARDTIVATQFHPEKSGKNGLLLLKNFLRL